MASWYSSSGGRWGDAPYCNHLCCDARAFVLERIDSDPWTSIHEVNIPGRCKCLSSKYRKVRTRPQGHQVIIIDLLRQNGYHSYTSFTKRHVMIKNWSGTRFLKPLEIHGRWPPVAGGLKIEWCLERVEIQIDYWKILDQVYSGFFVGNQWRIQEFPDEVRGHQPFSLGQ